jgi:N-acylneuraminate cytidylyltransferase
MKTIIVAPHPDDEILGAAGTLLRRKVEGGQIAWVIATSISTETGWAAEKVDLRKREIAEVAQHCGATVPFMRPDTLADDYTATIPVVRHSIEWFTAEVVEPAEVCCIYATAPFVQPEDLQKGLELLVAAPDCNYAFSVTSYPFPIQRAIRITDGERVEMFNPEHFNTRSQDLEEAWHDAGQFYWGRARAWLTGEPVFSLKSVPFRLPRQSVQDIDTLEDWSRAEWLFKAMQELP